jgi:hypothetical protein
MFTSEYLAKNIVKEIVNNFSPGKCFYVGKFKPPNKGHYDALKYLISKPYLQQVKIIISNKPIDNITGEESVDIWNMYMESDPTVKVKIKLSDEVSPVVDVIHYLDGKPPSTSIYVAVGEDDDQGYLQALQNKYGAERVKEVIFPKENGIVTSTQVRSIISDGDYETFKQTIPTVAYNKGMAPKIFKMLSTKNIESNQNG